MKQNICKKLRYVIMLLSAVIMFTGCEEIFGNGEELGYVHSIQGYYNSFNNTIELSWQAEGEVGQFDLWYYTSQNGNPNHITTLSGYQYTYSHQIPQTGVTYYYQIRVIGFNGDYGEYYTSYGIDTYNGGNGGGSVGVVNNLSGNFTNGQIQLSWNAVDNVDGYEIEVSVGDQYNFQYHDNITGGQTSYNFTVNNAGTDHYFKVRAYTNINGNYNYGEFSEVLQVSTGYPMTAVGNFSAVYDGSYIQLNWSSQPNVDGYRLEVSVGNAFSWNVILNENSTSYSYYNVFTNTEYYFRIVAYRGGTDGPSGDNLMIFTDPGGSSTQTGESAINQLDNWSYFDGTAGQTLWYYFSVESGSSYNFRMEDQDTPGTGSTGNVTVALFREDKTTLYSGLDSITSGYNQQFPVTVSGFDTKLYVKVTVQSSGQFGLRLDNIVQGSSSIISNLTVNDGAVTMTPDFAPAVTTYELDIPDSLSALTFSDVFPDDLNASISATVDNVSTTISGGQIYVAGFTAGQTRVVKITVVSQDSTSTTTYTFNINVLSSNSVMTNIVPGAGTMAPAFNMNTHNYTVTVPFEVTTLSIQPVAEVNTSVITVNNTQVTSGTSSAAVNLAVGTNSNAFIVNIESEAGVGTSHTYYIDVVRLQTADFDLIVGNALDIDYDEASKTYFVGVNVLDTQSNITVEPIDTTANVTIDGSATTSLNVSLNAVYSTLTVPIVVTPGYGTGTAETFYVEITRSWTSDSPGNQTSLLYAFDANAGHIYTVQWDDLVNGSGSFNDDVVVTGYHQDQVTVINGFDYINSAYSNPVTFTANATETIYLDVESLDGGNVGSFGIRVYNETLQEWVVFKTSGNNSVVVE